MKFSSKVEKCGQSPMRKFHPMRWRPRRAASGLSPEHRPARRADPSRLFEAIRKFEQPVLEYAPSPGIPELIDAIKGYYDKLDMHFDKSEIYITTGGSEALAITLQCISTTATRSSSPSRSTPTTTPWCAPAARPSSHPDLPRGGLSLRRAREDRSRSSTSIPAPSWSRTPAIPPAWC